MTWAVYKCTNRTNERGKYQILVLYQYYNRLFCNTISILRYNTGPIYWKYLISFKFKGTNIVNRELILRQYNISPMYNQLLAKPRSCVIWDRFILVVNTRFLKSEISSRSQLPVYCLTILHTKSPVISWRYRVTRH